jgi:hypothetical protein
MKELGVQMIPAYSPQARGTIGTQLLHLAGSTAAGVAIAGDPKPLLGGLFRFRLLPTSAHRHLLRWRLWRDETGRRKHAGIIGKRRNPLTVWSPHTACTAKAGRKNPGISSDPCASPIQKIDDAGDKQGSPAPI